MNELIEIRNYIGKGYKPLVAYDKWRVAVLRHLDELDPVNLVRMERHLDTDEVFILVNGACVLLLGGKGEKPGNIEAYAMRTGEVYNVKKAVWHSSSVSHDAHVIIVENDDTSEKNSEFGMLTDNDRVTAQNIAARLLMENSGLYARR